MAPDYEFLTLMQKVEVFEYALDNTTGQDLYRMLWLRSVNSEAWLDRRATYTRSLAVNSMVGHILGLGDRHPSNILIERATGKVVHIDFGDCFEVAMHREKFPETVAFRLTRMLTHAMEVRFVAVSHTSLMRLTTLQVSGIQGSFKHTCELTMQVVRDNKDSLMAVLEAFVYDPLISWRLMQADVDVRTEGTRLQTVCRIKASIADSKRLFRLCRRSRPCSRADTGRLSSRTHPQSQSQRERNFQWWVPAFRSRFG